MLSSMTQTDPVVAIVTEKRRQRLAVPRNLTDEEEQAVTEQQVALDKQLIKVQPVCLAGVLAGLEEAAYELKTFIKPDDDGARIILSRIEVTIRFLKNGGAVLPESGPRHSCEVDPVLGDMPSADRIKALDDAADKALAKMHDIRALGSALQHVLNDAENRDHEPLLTALYLAGIIEKQAEKQANKIDIISLGINALRRDLKREAASL